MYHDRARSRARSEPCVVIFPVCDIGRIDPEANSLEGRKKMANTSSDMNAQQPIGYEARILLPSSPPPRYFAKWKGGPLPTKLGDYIAFIVVAAPLRSSAEFQAYSHGVKTSLHWLCGGNTKLFNKAVKTFIECATEQDSGGTGYRGVFPVYAEAGTN
jgi:hypothetical protein